MCTPLIIAGIALTAGSIVANSVASSQAENARSEVLASELTRQKSYNREVEQLNTQSQDRYVGFEPQQDQRADELAGMFGAEVGGATAGVMPLSSSTIVNDETAKQTEAAQGYVDQQAASLGDLRSFGDLLGAKSLLQARDASKVGQIGGFKQGSQNIVPLELDTANKAGDGMKLFGDVLRIAGSAATGGGVNGGTWGL